MNGGELTVQIQRDELGPKRQHCPINYMVFDGYIS